MSRKDNLFYSSLGGLLIGSIFYAAGYWKGTHDHMPVKIETGWSVNFYNGDSVSDALVHFANGDQIPLFGLRTNLSSKNKGPGENQRLAEYAFNLIGHPETCQPDEIYMRIQTLLNADNWNSRGKAKMSLLTRLTELNPLCIKEINQAVAEQDKLRGLWIAELKATETNRLEEIYREFPDLYISESLIEDK